jgi:hypothetical protein
MVRPIEDEDAHGSASERTRGGQPREASADDDDQRLAHDTSRDHAHLSQRIELRTSFEDKERSEEVFNFLARTPIPPLRHVRCPLRPLPTRRARPHARALSRLTGGDATFVLAAMPESTRRAGAGAEA